MDDRFDITRRKALAAIGSIGVASAGAGLGTSAYFSDQETFENNQLTAGTLDMKVGYSAHYSDWKPDEDGTAEDESVEDVVMYGGEPGATGTAEEVPDGYTGLPTNDAWLIAVTDPVQFLENTQYSDPELDGTVPCDEEGADADDLERPVVELDDVKPGDFGEVTFDVRLCDNPGYLWLRGGLVDASENGVTEPEADDADEDQNEDGSLKEGDGEPTVELLDVVRVAVWPDDGNNYQNGDEAPEFVGSLREVIVGELGAATPPGVPLHGDIPAEEGGGTGRNCFSGDTEHSVAFAWWVPVDHGNEIQSDTATFDLGFYTEQCRHNDGTTDLVAHYPFEGDATDLSENGLGGNLVNGASIGTGKQGQALVLDGSDDYVEVPDDPALDITGPYTEAAWVNLNSTSGRHDITMRDPGQWTLGFQVRNGHLRAGFEDESDNNYIGTGGTVAAGTWAHLAVVYDGDSVTGYVDGSQVFDITQSSDGTGIDVSDATPATNDEPLRIGRGEEYLDGRIDDLRIYSRALSASEIQALYDSA